MFMELEKGRLGKAVKAARIARKMTQEQLAEEVEVVPMYVKQLESERRSPSLKVLVRLARVLNLSLDCIVFPEQPEGEELRSKIERRLRGCSVRDLSIILAAVEAMAEISDDS